MMILPGGLAAKVDVPTTMFPPASVEVSCGPVMVCPFRTRFGLVDRVDGMKTEGRPPVDDVTDNAGEFTAGLEPVLKTGLGWDCCCV